MSSQGSQTNERLAVVETKVDRIASDITEIKEDVKSNSKSLDEHMRRTELNEVGLADFRKKFFLVLGLYLTIEVLKTGGVDGVVKLVPFLSKLFGL